MLTALMMERIIRANGHLTLEGTETAAELREAVNHLMGHTYTQCYRQELGEPIDALIPDATVLTVRSGRKKSVTSVAISTGSL
jgi:hypothetical protein